MSKSRVVPCMVVFCLLAATKTLLAEAPGDELLRYRLSAGDRFTVTSTIVEDYVLESEVVGSFSMRKVARKLDDWQVTGIDHDGSAELQISVLDLVTEGFDQGKRSFRLNSAVLGGRNPAQSAVEISRKTPDRVVLSARGEVRSLNGNPGVGAALLSLYDRMGFAEQGKLIAEFIGELPGADVVAAANLSHLLPTYPQGNPGQPWTVTLARSLLAPIAGIEASYRVESWPARDHRPIRLVATLKDTAPGDAPTGWAALFSALKLEGEASYTIDPSNGMPRQLRVQIAIRADLSLSSAGEGADGDQAPLLLGTLWVSSLLQATIEHRPPGHDPTAPAYEVAWTVQFPDLGAADPSTLSLDGRTEGPLLMSLRGTSADGGASDVFVALDAKGRLLWSKTFDGVSAHGRPAAHMRPDGTIIVALSSGDDIRDRGVDLVVIGADGEVERRETIATGLDQAAHAVVGLPNGDVLISGRLRAADPDGGDAWVVRLDETWRSRWAVQFGSPRTDVARDAAAGGNGTVIASGSARRVDDAEASWVRKIVPQRGTVWDRVYTRLGHAAYAGLAALPRRGFALLMNSDSSDLRAPWIILLDDDGGVIWDRLILGGPERQAHAVESTARGTLLVAGTYRQDFVGWRAQTVWISELDRNGTLVWDGAYALPGMPESLDLAALSDGGFALAFAQGAAPGDGPPAGSTLLRFAPGDPPAPADPVPVDAAVVADWRHYAPDHEALWSEVYQICLQRLGRVFEDASPYPAETCAADAEAGYRTFFPDGHSRE